MRMCSVPDCGGKHQARGFCKPHYNEWYQRSMGYERVDERMNKPLRSDNLRLPDITAGMEGNLISLVRALPGKKGL